MRLLASLAMTTSFLFGAALEGNTQSPVRVVIFEDLQCSDCAKLRVMLDTQLLPKYGRAVAFEHRDFPLAKHSWSRRGAMAARYFDSQNPTVGVEFRRQALANLDKIEAEDLASWIASFARQYAVDPVKAVASMSSASLAAQVEKDLAEGVARGVAKTPTVFVDDEPFVETFTFEAISHAIEAALAAARK